MHRRAFMAAIGLSPLGILPAVAAAPPEKEPELIVTNCRGADIAQVQRWARQIENLVSHSLKTHSDRRGRL